MGLVGQMACFRSSRKKVRSSKLSMSTLGSVPSNKQEIQMKIEHVAFWVRDLEGMRDFYCKYFDLLAGPKYVNEKKQFSSYFLSFKKGARIELMHRIDITDGAQRSSVFGLTHLAISVGSNDRVDKLTERLRSDGVMIVGEPRTTGDGYYESVIEDPEGNQIEITT